MFRKRKRPRRRDAIRIALWRIDASGPARSRPVTDPLPIPPISASAGWDWRAPGTSPDPDRKADADGRGSTSRAFGRRGPAIQAGPL